MARPNLERINLILEKSKLKRLRRVNGARSNSEAVRNAIDHELAIKGIQTALRRLRERGTLEDVFNRAPSRRTKRK
ncbi:MAG TPA: hypothetical protein VG028_02770 [Terriglobia bacterium]|nr:hypothetical protein [Terriglobia bacterium]